MENFILELKKKIIDLEIKQSHSINIIKVIEILCKEREYYNILAEHAQIVADLDSELEVLRIKKADYQLLLSDYIEYINDHHQ